MAKIGRPRTCECGECARCKQRERARIWWQSLPIERRREIIAARDPEKIKANERARYQRNREQRKAVNDEWKRQNPERWRKVQDAWNARNPEKVSAHATVARAIRAGKLVRQPCEVCGRPAGEAHHDDYSRPLDVRWLCRKHHAEHHFVQADAA